MWRFLEEEAYRKFDEVSSEIPQSDETSDEEPQASDQSHYISSSTTGRKKIRLYDESYLSMGSHGPVIQAVLFHCVSSVATDFKCSNDFS